MPHFAPEMISMTYDRLAKPFVSLSEMNPFAFALVFPPGRGPKRKGREIDDGFKLARRTRRNSADRKWRRKLLESLKTDSEMAPGQFTVASKENRSANFVSLLGHAYVRRGRILHAHDMVARINVEDFAGDAARH
jgi:hypothetical protein